VPAERGQGRSVRRAGAGRVPAYRSWAPDGAGAEFGGRPGTQVADGRLPPPAPRADPRDEPTDGDVEGVLSAGPGGRGVDDGPAARLSAGVSHPREPDRPLRAPVAAVGAGA